MRRPSASLMVFCILAIGVLVANFSFRSIKMTRSEPLTLNTYAVGNTEDYHQYMYILKRGTKGHLLYHNAYSEETIPDVFIQPFYHIAGFIFGALKISIYDIYFILHLFGFIVLFFTIYVLIQRTIPTEIGRIAALFFFISATGFWTISSLSPLTVLRQYLPDFNFDLFIKYHVMQPHHDVSIALFILAICSLSQQVYTRKHIIIGGGAMALLGLIHPYIQLFLFFSLIVDHMARLLLMKQEYFHYGKRYILPVLWAIPTAFLTYYIFVHVLQFEIGLKGVVTYLERNQTFPQYVLSLGPLLLTSLLSFLFVKQLLTSGLLRLTCIWAYLPLLLFFLPDYHIPINTWRLFQTYQHIPLAILSAFALVRIAKQIPRIAFALPIIAVVLLCYGLPIYVYGFYESIKPTGRLIWTVDVPNVLITLFSYLDQISPPDSVVLAGPQTSSLIPEFTHNHVIIGHNGNNRNFLEKQKEISEFLMGVTPVDHVRPLLDTYRVSYMIFGIDAPFFKDTKYANLPYLKEVYIEPKSGFSVVEVLRDK